jgi:hypothetical protein
MLTKTPNCRALSLSPSLPLASLNPPFAGVMSVLSCVVCRGNKSSGKKTRRRATVGSDSDDIEVLEFTALDLQRAYDE